MEVADHQNQVRRGPVEDDEIEHYGAVRQIAEEHDPTESIFNIGPLLSHEYRSTSLQISSCTPSTELKISLDATMTEEKEFCWSAAVLSAFDRLPALNTEEVKTLNSVIGLSLSSQPAGVKDFLVTFQSHPDHYSHLRKLAQQLKVLGREDIVKAMHQETAALRWLGPVLPEERLIRDILPSLWVQLTVKLSLFHPKGYDWQWLAERLSIPRDFIDLWKQKGEVPADNVLKTWQVKVSEATVGRLFDLLIEHREDLAAML